MPGGLKKFAESSGELAEEWKDVLALVHDAREPQPASPLTFAGPFAQTMPGEPTYGTPIHCGALVFAPTNEFGVLFLFGAIADRLGFLVLRVQAQFPDIEALRMVGRDKLQRVRIELEQESRNFLKHGHDPNGCDLIVCWEHNWEECPLEVIELKTMIAEIGNAKPLTTKDTKEHGGENNKTYRGLARINADQENQNLTTEARRHGEQRRSEKAESLTTD